MRQIATRITVIDWIIVAIRVKVNSIRSIGIKVIYAVRRDKSTPLGVIISRVKVVELCFSIVVVTSITNRIIRGEVIGNKRFCCTITPSIVAIACNLCARTVKYAYYVTLDISVKVEGFFRRTQLLYRSNNSAFIVEIGYISGVCTSAAIGICFNASFTNKSTAMNIFIISQPTPNVNTPFAKKKEARGASFGGKIIIVSTQI